MSVTATAKDLAKGHRERLRKRFMAGGADAVQEYELLELLLFNAIPRRDVKPLAKVLLQTFGTFADVINAPPDQLADVVVPVEGKPPLKVGARALAEFAVVRASALKLTSANVRDRVVLTSWDDLVAYCRSACAYEQVEQFRILFLNNKNALIADEKQQTGTINHTPVYVREVIKRALTLNAGAIILVHNHPSGDPTPSRADIVMTQKIVDAAKAVELVVHDHLIIGRGQEVSFRQLELVEW
ncbi:DNA repair protein RadC [Parvularcula sp. ZS-1/3]|uniref:DNA repair protein RadC n=1 Tax=Parvularcula mediterranea TaxID=2732508 RepID=A0A7Y3RMU5_9PROT|nr:DNA repair protein RadC [Parvularcula mediterranea]NNU16924.1 DNA repair protein RadC [Parvularcula mediterranea]